MIEIKKFDDKYLTSYFINIREGNFGKKLKTISTISTNLVLRVYSNGISFDVLGGVEYINKSFVGKDIKFEHKKGLYLIYFDEHLFGELDRFDIEDRDDEGKKIADAVKILQVDNNIVGIEIKSNLLELPIESILSRSVIQYD